MRLSEKYRPHRLADMVGQPGIVPLLRFVQRPYACCFLFEGPPGCGKTTAALALGAELGCEDEFSGLHVVTSTEMTIDRCRDLFECALRLRPMNGNGWRTLVIEELEALTSVQVQRYLKTALEQRLPEKCVVVATSNGAGAIERADKALLQRFRLYRFEAGKMFAAAAEPYLAMVWKSETGLDRLPLGWKHWGTDGEGDFSLRVALDQLQVEAELRWDGEGPAECAA